MQLWRAASLLFVFVARAEEVRKPCIGARLVTTGRAKHGISEAKAKKLWGNHIGLFIISTILKYYINSILFNII